MAEPAEVWAVGGAYEPYVGRWSRLVAQEFLAWVGVDDGALWLDVGCGTGALSQTVLTAADPAAVVSLDPSAGYLNYAQAQLADRRAGFVMADARRLPLADGRFDAVVSGLVLNFVPDPAQAVREMARVTRPGGRVAAYVWDYAGRMELIRHFWDAAAAIDPAAAELDEGRRFGLCQPQPLASLIQDAGLVEVDVQAIQVPTRFRDFEDYWTPFLGGQGPAPGYARGLDEAQRAVLAEELRGRLPVAADGSIPLVARAWAVRATAAAGAATTELRPSSRLQADVPPPAGTSWSEGTTDAGGPMGGRGRQAPAAGGQAARKAVQAGQQALVSGRLAVHKARQEVAAVVAAIETTPESKHKAHRRARARKRVMAAAAGAARSLAAVLAAAWRRVRKPQAG
jgi:SAM-dependent methyltransferase